MTQLETSPEKTVALLMRAGQVGKRRPQSPTISVDNFVGKSHSTARKAAWIHAFNKLMKKTSSIFLCKSITCTKIRVFCETSMTSPKLVDGFFNSVDYYTC